MSTALKKLFGNPAIITFLLINLFMGIGWGAADAYLAIYLNEELGATYVLIGNCNKPILVLQYLSGEQN
jgi:hypothetical protein